MTYPACFTSQQAFDEWTALAKIAREEASPCSDCTRRYRAKMQDEGRCDREVVRKDFAYAPKKPINIKEVLPA